MRAARWAALVLAPLAPSDSARAAIARTFDVPAGPLGIVAGRIGAQAGITIILADAALAGRRSAGARGRLTVRAALARALAGTGAEARFHDDALVRIVPARAARPRPPAPPPAPAPAAEPEGEIIVTASKQGTPLDRYPGSVVVIPTPPGWAARFGPDGVSALTRLLPSVSATNLGAGREKIFIRGVADSSFTGPTQAATGLYLGDVRLTYNAPDPALSLHDMVRVEVLVGPQASLYGAGSLGGVIRLVPRAPDVRAVSASAEGSVAFTRHGAPGASGAAMLNLPLKTGRWGLRAVFSAEKRGGYIDAPAQAAKDINRTRSFGHRVTLRGADLAGWTIDIGHVGQSIRSDTGQYVLRGGPDLARDEPFAQPFRSDYRLAHVNAARSVGSRELVSVSAFARHRLSATGDASVLVAGPLLARQRNAITIVSNETRLSGGGGRAPWVAGVGVIHSRSFVSAVLLAPGGGSAGVGVVNGNLDAAIYGRATRPMTSTLSGTVGARLTYARTESYVRDLPASGIPRTIRNAARFTRTIGLDWRPGGVASGFFRHDQGYRAGGLTAAPSIVGLAGRGYRPDTLDMYELGVRVGDIDKSPVALRASIFSALWDDVQADLVDAAGVPYTANVGEGRINGLDADLRLRFGAITATAAAFLNDSRLTGTEDEGDGRRRQPLPNVAGFGGRIGLDWRRETAAGAVLNGHAALRYVGRSRLGVGSVLNIGQGHYLVADAGIRLTAGRLSLSADIDNVTDTRGNSFAFGNPFTVARRDQTTPLRPRTVRLGIGMAF